MVIDDRLLEEYAFDGVFYTYEEDTSKPLLEQEKVEVEVFRTKCDIQPNSGNNKTGFLDSDWAVYFPLEEMPQAVDVEPENPETALSEETRTAETEGSEAAPGEGAEPETGTETTTTESESGELINGKTWSNVVIKRGMYFRGEIYGYEVNGKVTGVGPSMLGGCVCYIKDMDE